MRDLSKFLTFMGSYNHSFTASLVACHVPNLCFLVAQMVNTPPAMQENQVWSHGQEDPFEKGMVIHSNILAWRISWTEEPGGESMEQQTAEHNWSNLAPMHACAKLSLLTQLDDVPGRQQVLSE